MQTPRHPCHYRLTVVSLLLASLTATAGASNVGRRYPSEMRRMTDPVTGVAITVLTTDPANDAKPYQTHPTWTADGNWMLFRSNRGGNGQQAFLVNVHDGTIVQLTDGPRTGTGSLNLSIKEMKLFYMRGGPAFGRDVSAESALPRELVELDLARLLADSQAGGVQVPATYERVVAVLPADLRDSGGFALDADETKAYWGVAFGPPPPRPERPAGRRADGAPGEQGLRRQVDNANTDPTESREAARLRFAEAGRGPGGIRAIDLRTGAISTVIDVDLRMGHVQTNPWVPGEIIYCHETTGDAPQRIWAVNADGTNHRPVYVETPDEWVTHETMAGRDEVMFNLMGHLPYLRERPTGVAVVNLRTREMKLLGQIEEGMGRGRLGGFWHCNGSPDGRWAVADSFQGNVWLIDRRNGEQILLSTGHVMRPDHTHPIFSPDGRTVAIQSGQLSKGESLDLMLLEMPAALLGRK